MKPTIMTAGRIPTILAALVIGCLLTFSTHAMAQSLSASEGADRPDPAANRISPLDAGDQNMEMAGSIGMMGVDRDVAMLLFIFLLGAMAVFGWLRAGQSQRQLQAFTKDLNMFADQNILPGTKQSIDKSNLGNRRIPPARTSASGKDDHLLTAWEIESMASNLMAGDSSKAPTA